MSDERCSGEAQNVLGRVGAMYADRFQIHPISAAANIQPGMRLEFQHPAVGKRVGVGRVEEVDVDFGVLRMDARLNVIAPAIAEGDQVLEWEMPCSRCRCRQCEAERASPARGENKP